MNRTEYDMNRRQEINKASLLIFVVFWVETSNHSLNYSKKITMQPLVDRFPSALAGCQPDFLIYNRKKKQLPGITLYIKRIPGTHHYKEDIA